ncbi:hypothetical protein [Pseudomonas chlororaphis]|uniref:hypothetical protein n=1 Tax=Pseudomonas chlororaphis TaxID=587753 RepID=UPI0039E422DE
MSVFFSLFRISGDKAKWLLFTVAFGAAPILIRMLIAMLVTDGSVVMFAISDFVALGIVLQVSIFNEVRHRSLNDADWNTIMMGVSAFYILIYAVLYALSLISEVWSRIDGGLLKNISMGFALISFLLCYAVYDRIRLGNGRGGDTHE